LSAKLKALIASVVLMAVAIMTIVIVAVPLGPNIGGWQGLAFWTVVVALSSAVPVRMPGGAIVNVGTAPILAAAALGGPTAAVLVAAVGTLEWREIRGFVAPGSGVPWYGTLYNHAEAAIPAAFAGLICYVPGSSFDPNVTTLIAVCVAGLAYFAINNIFASVATALRDGRSSREVFLANTGQVGFSFAGLAPLSWLMASMYVVAGPIGVLPFAVPLIATRSGYKKIVEIRDMFTQTVRSLASAVDAKDPYTAGHSVRVQLIRRTWARRCAALSRSSKRSSGAACSTTSARSASPTPSCSSRAL